MPGSGDTTTPARATLRVPYLDGVRALAALFVVVHHCYCMAYPIGYGVEVSSAGRPFVGWALYGHFGVTVFIVLAGFSLGLGLDPVSGRVRGGLLGFARRRAWRILPPYWIAIAITLALLLTVIGTKTGTHWDLSLPVDPKGWLVDALLLQDLWFATPVGNVSYPFWSISVEWHIYLLIPFVVVLRRWFPWRVVLSAGAAIAIAAIFVGQYHAAVRYLQPSYYLLFLLGIAASLLIRSDGFARSRFPWSTLASVLLAIVAVVCATRSFAQFSDSLWWLDVVCGGGVLAALLAVHRREHGPARTLLGAAGLRRAAASSYTLYLLHAPLLQLFWLVAVLPFGLPRSMQLLLGWTVAVPLVVLISAFMSRWMERPFTRRASAARPIPARRTSSKVVWGLRPFDTEPTP